MAAAKPSNSGPIDGSCQQNKVWRIWPFSLRLQYDKKKKKKNLNAKKKKNSYIEQTFGDFFSSHLNLNLLKSMKAKHCWHP